MKNIEKYTNTKDALEAYNTIGDKWISFDNWLELEYKDPSPLTLIEAAEAVKNTWHAKMPDGSLQNLRTSISNLADAIEREKAKPIRNCDLLSDAQEALTAIHEDRCYVNNPIDERRLTVEWLFDEAKGCAK